MRAFAFRRAASLAEAAQLLSRPDALPLGGGTDLLPSIDDGLFAPSLLVDVRTAADGPMISESPDGLRILAAARLHDIATDTLARARVPALALACGAAASPALRHMGTLGGNLCQRPRCWYLRRGVACHKNGGSSCPAKDGENQHHAILDGGPCWMVHPSDPAVALVALGASVEARRGATTRAIAIESFFALPRDRMDRETSLQDGEFVVAVIIPAAAGGGRQVFRKLTQREAWDFALASIAAARRDDGSVRIALGGIAPRPWRAPESVEEDAASGGLDEDSINALAERAMYDAVPLARNGYKVQLAQSLLRDALREIAA